MEGTQLDLFSAKPETFREGDRVRVVDGDREFTGRVYYDGGSFVWVLQSNTARAYKRETVSLLSI